MGKMKSIQTQMNFQKQKNIRYRHQSFMIIHTTFHLNLFSRYFFRFLQVDFK